MKKKVSLVLSGGGAKGIAHIAVIEELEKNGFDIHSIAGTSMGALVGGVYALGKMEEYKNWILTLDRRKVFKLVDFSLGKQGLIKGERVFNTMKEFIPDARIEDLSISYAAIAADLKNKEEVAFSSGSVFDAIRASVAIPSVLTPVKTNDRILVDGGVLNNLPVNHAKRIPDDILVVVNVNADIPVYKPKIPKAEEASRLKKYQAKVKEFQNHLSKIKPSKDSVEIGYFNLINKTINLMISNNAIHSLKNSHPDILVEISGKSCATYDFYKAEELLEIGRYAANKSISRYLRK